MTTLNSWTRLLPDADPPPCPSLSLQVQRNMARERPLSSDGLAALYLFGPLGVKPTEGGGGEPVREGEETMREGGMQ